MYPSDEEIDVDAAMNVAASTSMNNWDQISNNGDILSEDESEHSHIRVGYQTWLLRLLCISTENGRPYFVFELIRIF